MVTGVLRVSVRLGGEALENAGEINERLDVTGGGWAFGLLFKILAQAL